MRSFLLFLIILTVLTSCAQDNQYESNPTLITNQEYIDALYTSGPDLKNVTDVFYFLLSNLDDEVTIYPTENYFYFTLSAGGRNIGGTLTLFPEQRDRNVIGLNYYEKGEDPDWYFAYQDKENTWIGNGTELGINESVFVKKIKKYKYSVSFKGRTVVFNLNDVGLEMPESIELTSDEEYVGPIIDESGLKFFILFNKKTSRMYFILNEDEKAAEYFEPLFNRFIIDRRTAFIFYDDVKNKRKILVGVHGKNVLKNNWFDGPFDQMPDNLIAEDRIPDYQKYIELSFPSSFGRADKFGRYNDTSRVAVAPYTVYFTFSDFANKCNDRLPESEFFTCMTVPKFELPRGFYVAKYG